jgi:hypothetical protein
MCINYKNVHNNFLSNQEIINSGEFISTICDPKKKHEGIQRKHEEMFYLYRKDKLGEITQIAIHETDLK